MKVIGGQYDTGITTQRSEMTHEMELELLRVRLNGGPSNGMTLSYYKPLPNVLVIPRLIGDRIRYSDYKRRGPNSREYDYVDKDVKENGKSP